MALDTRPKSRILPLLQAVVSQAYPAFVLPPLCDQDAPSRHRPSAKTRAKWRAKFAAGPGQPPVALVTRDVDASFTDAPTEAKAKALLPSLSAFMAANQQRPVAEPTRHGMSPAPSELKVGEARGLVGSAAGIEDRIGGRPSAMDLLMALMEAPVGESAMVLDIQIQQDRLVVAHALQSNPLVGTAPGNEARAQYVYDQLQEIALHRFQDARVTYLETVRTARRLGLNVGPAEGVAHG